MDESNVPVAGEPPETPGIPAPAEHDQSGRAMAPDFPETS